MCCNRRYRNILADTSNSVNAQCGPWPPAALTRRALADLKETAALLHRRGHDPLEIFVFVHDRAGLLAAAYRITPVPVTPIVADAIGQPDWQPQNQIDGLVAERKRRASVAGEWLLRHAGEPIAERAVRAMEVLFCEDLEAMLDAQQQSIA